LPRTDDGFDLFVIDKNCHWRRPVEEVTVKLSSQHQTEENESEKETSLINKALLMDDDEESDDQGEVGKSVSWQFSLLSHSLHDARSL
jgi:hypothetical protein